MNPLICVNRVLPGRLRNANPASRSIRRACRCLALAWLCGAATSSALGQGEKLEPTAAGEGSTSWFDLRQLDVEGRGWDDTQSFYDRLPARAEAMVRRPVWGLSHDSAGLCARFVTDATTLHARWVLRRQQLAMPHMPATGVSGLDLYVKGKDNRWRWLAGGRPTHTSTNSVQLVSGLEPGTREFLLYLPLYNGVSEVALGLPDGAALWKADPYRPGASKPIVFYGTSITQGGCASRPGMVHTAILGRRLHCPVINLGFSGSGTLDPEMAELLGELDASVYVLDCLPNMTAAMVRERVEPFVTSLRSLRPATPILLVEDRTYANATDVPSSRDRNLSSRSELRQAYATLRAAGISGLHYLPGNGLLGDDRDNEATVDGSHPTDLGFMRQADAFQEVLGTILPAEDSTPQ